MKQLKEKILAKFYKKFVFETEKDGGWCFLKTTNPDEIKPFLISAIDQATAEAREDLIKMIPEKRGTANYNNSHEAIMNGDKDYGFNSAIDEIRERLNKLKKI